MRESLNLATVGFNIGNDGGIAGARCRSIGHGALLRGGGVRPEERDEAGAFMHGETVRNDYGITNAVGAGIRVTILQMDAFPFYRSRREMGPGGEELGVRGLHGIAQIGAECEYAGRPCAVRQAGETGYGEGGNDPDQADEHDHFDERMAVVSRCRCACAGDVSHPQCIGRRFFVLSQRRPRCEAVHRLTAKRPKKKKSLSK